MGRSHFKIESSFKSQAESFSFACLKKKLSITAQTSLGFLCLCYLKKKNTDLSQVIFKAEEDESPCLDLLVF